MGAAETRSCRVVVVGGGKMGEAIVSGWLEAHPAALEIRPADVTIVEPNADRRAHLQGVYARFAHTGESVALIGDLADVRDTPDIVVLAVKPQVMGNVLESIRAVSAFKPADGHPLFVSIAAGLSTETLEAGLPEAAPLVRVMPNMPLAIGCGASGVCAGSAATTDQVRLVADLFSSLGRAVVVDEKDMDIVCALSGSGPAYVAAMIEALRDAASAHGLDAALAEALALQTVLGTARLIDEGDQSIAEVRQSICSPGGTTIAALEAMEAAGFGDVFKHGVDAAVMRSKELAQCS